MKANEAPEKIYLNPLLMEDGESIVRQCTFERQRDSQIEYIRTDYANKRFIVDAKTFLSEIHRVCDITDENGYRIELRDLQARFENYINEKLL